MFVSGHLALLASLFPALVLPVVDAAYIPGRHPEAQHVHRFSPVVPPSRFGRHHPVSGHHHAHADSDRAHKKVPKSAFSRHRQRRDSGSLTRRSSIYVTGDDGDTYLVSRSHAGKHGHHGSGEQHSHSHGHPRRQSNQVVGRVDIMGTAQSSDSPQRLASLTVDSTPTNWSPGQNDTKVFDLNASATNRTQFIMMVRDDPSDATSFNKHVSLAMQVFDADSAETIMYCATYDPDPAVASALVMAPCATPSATALFTTSDDENDDPPSSDPHQSQIFSYDPFSGQIQPVTSVSNTTSDLDERCGSNERRDTSDSSTNSGVIASNAKTSAVPSQKAQNVTLMYVPEDIEVPPSSRSLGTTSASQGKEAVLTTTVTVVATVTASVSSSKGPTPVQAAATISTTSPPPSPPSTSKSTKPSPKPPSDANESLQVEIIGVSPTGTASSSSGSSTTTTHSTSSTSLDAQAIASSIVNSWLSHSHSSSSTTTKTTATPVVVGLSRRSRAFGRV